MTPHPEPLAEPASAAKTSPHPGEDREERAARQRRDRRAQIVEVAKEAFSELGYHRASISEIIGRAGIARGTFYLYFENKRAVFDSILNQALDDLRDRIEGIEMGPGAPSPREQLEQNFVRVLSYLRADRPLTQLLLNQGLTPDLEAAEEVSGFYDHVTRQIDSSLQHGVRMGLVRPCNTMLVASCVCGAIRGLVGHLSATPETFDVAAITQELIAFALRGVVVTEVWEGR